MNAKKRTHARWLALIAGLLLAALVASACGGPATTAPAAATSPPAEEQPEEVVAAPAAMDEITFCLSWRYKAEFGTIILADDKGFFEEQGIQVEIVEGKGSSDAAKLVANQSCEFGYLNLTTAAIAVSEGAPIRAIAGLVQKSPQALLYYMDNPVEHPRDLEGKSIAYSQGDALATIWDAFVEKWDIDTDQVEVVIIDAGAKDQLFLAERVDTVVTFVNNPPDLSQVERDYGFMMLGDWGFNTLNNGLVTHADVIRDNPDLVRRVVQAIANAYEYALDHPEEALDAVLARSEELSLQPRDKLMQDLVRTLDLLHSQASEGKPIGWMAADDWNNTIETLFENEGIARRVSNEEVYTNEFIPGAELVVEEPAVVPVAMDELTFCLSWRYKAEHGTVILADDMGFFEEQNIKVDIVEGSGSSDAAKLVANKSCEFGYLNTTTAAIAISREAPIMVIAGFVQKSPQALLFYTDNPLEHPKDLEGKSIAYSQGDALATIWDAFVERWDIDADQVDVVIISEGTADKLFVTENVDVIVFFVNNVPDLSAAEREYDYMLLGDWGFNTLNNGLVTHTDLVRDNPDLVRRVVQALVNAYEYARDNPDAALDAVLARSEELSLQPRDKLLDELIQTLNLLHSLDSAGKPTGWMAEADWDNTIDTLFQYGGIDTRVPNELVYTNEFIPGSP